MFVRLDMEDHRVTQATIDVVVDLHQEGLTNVGTVYQGDCLELLMISLLRAKTWFGRRLSNL